MIPTSIPALDNMPYAAGDSLAWIPLQQGRCACRQDDSGGGGQTGKVFLCASFVRLLGGGIVARMAWTR